MPRPFLVIHAARERTDRLTNAPQSGTGECSLQTATKSRAEDAANRFAVAFWRTQPGGEDFLQELERLATQAAANLPDPTPAGEDPVAYFGANYQALGRDPLKYGYYQFRFMRDALRERAGLDFARLVSASAR